MFGLKYGIDTLDIMINSLKNTKEKLETKDLLSNDIYGSFEILSTIYSSIEQVFGTEELNMFQKEYITIFIELLKSKINNSQFNFSIEIDEGFYIITVNTTYENQIVELFYINPYFKSIIPIENKYITTLKENLNILYEKQSEVLLEIDRLQNAKINPKEYTKDNFSLYAKSMFNKKGFERNLNNDLNQLQMSLLEIKRKISEFELDLKAYNESLSEITLEKNKFMKFLESNLDFTIINDSMA